MDWPITPTFFRKVAVYQRLADAEHGFKQKDIWDNEKVVLRWAVSAGHRLIGSPIDESHVQDLLKEEINKTLPKGDASGLKYIDYALVFSNNLLEALVMHGFAEVPLDAKNGKYSVRITPDGFMAGQILEETNDLQAVLYYKMATNAWWAAIVLGFIILVRQAFPWLPPLLWEWTRELIRYISSSPSFRCT